MCKLLIMLLMIRPAWFLENVRRGALNPDRDQRFTTMTSRTRRSTLPIRQEFEEGCDYLAYYCLKAYNTDKLCGRTIYYRYRTFENYCLLDYVNCMERYEMWQVVHMGECFSFDLLTEYALYHYPDDDFLDATYVVENH